MTVELFGKAFTRSVILSGKTVDRKDKRQIGICKTVNITALEIRFTPACYTTMVAVLKQECAVINAVDHISGVTTRPATQFGRCSRDISQAVRTKIIKHHIGVGIG